MSRVLLVLAVVAVLCVAHAAAKEEGGLKGPALARRDDVQDMFGFLPVLSRCRGDCREGDPECESKSRKCAICIDLVSDFAGNYENHCKTFETRRDQVPEDKSAVAYAADCEDMWTELTPHFYKMERHTQWCERKQNRPHPDCYAYNMCHQMECCE